MLPLQQGRTPSEPIPTKGRPFKALGGQEQLCEFFNVIGADELVDVSAVRINVGGFKTFTARTGGKPQQQRNTPGIHLQNAFATLERDNAEEAQAVSAPRLASRAKK